MAVDQPRPAKGGHRIIAVQAVLAVFVLIGSLTYPQAGATALAIPIGPSASARGLGWLDDAQIVGDAEARSHMLVRAGSNGTALAALTSGWLLLHVPVSLCGASRSRRT